MLATVCESWCIRLCRTVTDELSLLASPLHDQLYHQLCSCLWRPLELVSGVYEKFLGRCHGMITPVMINFIGAIEQLWPLSVMTCTNIFFISGLSEPFCGGYEKEHSRVSQNTHTRQVSFHRCHRKDPPVLCVCLHHCFWSCAMPPIYNWLVS